MAKKQSSILSYFKPKSIVPKTEQIETPFSLSKKKKKTEKKYENLDFIFLSSDSDDDDDISDEIKIIDPKPSNGTIVTANDSKPALKSAKELFEKPSDVFYDTEPFMSVTFEEGDEEKQTDSVKLTIADQTAEDYKWTNFRAMIDWVLQDNDNEHLFNDTDWSTLHSFTSLSVNCQRLYIRLFVRRRNWIRPTRMKYPDLGSDLQPLIDELVKTKFLSNCDSISDLREGLELLSNWEMKSLVKSLSGIAGNIHSKGDSIESIIKLCKTSTSIKSHFSDKQELLDQVALNRVKKVLGSSAYLVNEDMGRLFSRMTYLYYPPQVNEDENGVVLSHELLNAQQVELGTLRYPLYTINKREIIYQTRQDLIDYEVACRLESQILMAIEKKDADCIINKYLPQAQQGFSEIINGSNHQFHCHLANFLRNQTAGHVYTRCLHHIVSILEQQKQYIVAVEVLNMIYGQDTYCQHYKGRWLERMVINYESHLKRPDDAFSVIKKALKDPNVNFAFRYTLYTRGKKLAKSKKIKRIISVSECPEYEFAKCNEVIIEAPTLNKTLYGRKTLFTDISGSGSPWISVEQAAMNHYLANGYSQGLHTEGTVYHALLGLLFWDIIYRDIEDVFRFKNQTLPLDFVSNQFYAQRKTALDERLEQIRKSSLAELYQMMDNVWGTEMGCKSIIAWESCDLSQLKEIVCCLGNEPLAAICERLLKYFRFTRSGFPDLIVWDISSRNIKAVEVKGPGDTLSSKQILWLEYFNNCPFPAEVCYVRAAK